MKKHLSNHLLVLFIFAAASGLFAQSSETRNLGSFDEVSVSEGIKAKLRKGSSNKIKIEAENIDLNLVRTDIRGDELRIHIENDWKRKNRNIDVKVYLTFTDLEALDANSGAYVILEDEITSNSFDASVGSGANIKVEKTIHAKEMDIDASSGAYMYLADIDADELEVDVSSGGKIEVEGGKVNSLEVDVNSSGKLDAYDLRCRYVDADASSGGGVKIYAHTGLKADSSSGGWVYYKGSPDKVVERESSGGRVKAQ
ncbi:MAG: head GIN domain-containing protein [Bacteroidota bacterium]